MYTDYGIQTNVDHPLGVFCPCGLTIHLKESEAPVYDNLITCPKCGYQTHLIRPSKINRFDVGEVLYV